MVISSSANVADHLITRYTSDIPRRMVIMIIFIISLSTSASTGGHVVKWVHKDGNFNISKGLMRNVKISGKLEKPVVK